MNKVIICAVIAATAGLSSTAFAREQGRVLSSTPIYQQVAVPYQVCNQENVYRESRPSGAGAVIGAIAGGAAGNAVGKGNGRTAATALGVIGGAVIGNQIEGRGNEPRYEAVERCTTQNRYENQTIGYDVVYEYAGRRYSTRTQKDPGRWISINVQPQEQEYAQQPAYQAVPPGYAQHPPGYGQQPYGYVQPGVVTYGHAPVYGAPPPVTVIQYEQDDPRYHRDERHHGGYNNRRSTPYGDGN